MPSELTLKGKTYNTTFVPDYNILIGKLMTILSRNKNVSNFKYHGIIENRQKGILVEGIDSMGIREFEKFFPIKDIHHYFYKR